MIITQAFAYELETHADLSQAALLSSVLSQPSSAVLTDLGLEESVNIDRQFPGSSGVESSITQLFRTGARFEDSFPRPRHHFYDPFNNRPLTILGIEVGRTSPDWALEDGGQISGILGIGAQDFSFVDARGYLFKALTLPSEADRKKNFGLTFQTLGQVIHHLQDMAQPQHVRNDAHLDNLSLFGLENINPFANPSLYELWTDGNRGSLTSLFTGYAPTYSPSDRNTFNVPRNLWHTPGGKGIADFTNRNFVSAGTNFDKPGLFASPVLDEGNKTERDIQQLCADANPPCRNANLTGTITFYGNPVDDRYSGGPPVNNPFASSLSIFDRDLTKAGQSRIFTLNRFNFSAAHSFLIPRAVGYSAGLINYFFRGKIDFVPDPANPGGFLIQNLGPEPIKGQFALYYDDRNGERHPVPGAGGNALVWDTTVLLASASGMLNAGASLPVPGFTPPTNPAPKTIAEYMLVFSGEMGEERADAASNARGAVVGKMVKNPYQGGLYLAGLDANNNVLSLKVDPSGVTVLSGFDISKADAAHPNGVFVGNSGKFDPLQHVLATMAFQGFNVIPKAYLTKQAAVDPTSGIHQPLSATFAIPNAPPFVFNILSFVLSQPTDLAFQQVRWVAKSPDPAIGTFEFAFFGTRTPQSASLSYTRRFTVNGTAQTTSGGLELPTLTAPESYAQFFDATKPLLISGDGTLLANFVRQPDTRGGVFRTQLRIQLGAAPSAALETAHFPEITVRNALQTSTTTVIGSCSLPQTNEVGPVTTVTSTATRTEELAVDFEVRFSEDIPIEFVNGKLATFNRSSVRKRLWTRQSSGCVVSANNFNGTGFTPNFHIDRSAETVNLDSGMAQIQFNGGAFLMGQLDPPLDVVHTELGGDRRIDFVEGLYFKKQFSQHYDGGIPVDPGTLTTLTATPPASVIAFQIVRPLTDRREDVIYTATQIDGSQKTIPTFRGLDLTNKPYVADASPVGEVFFATSDLSTIIHEPKALSMPVIDRSMLPTNMIRLLAAVWL